jgi:hypothetical protein
MSAGSTVRWAADGGVPCTWAGKREEAQRRNQANRRKLREAAIDRTSDGIALAQIGYGIDSILLDRRSKFEGMVERSLRLTKTFTAGFSDPPILIQPATVCPKPLNFLNS